MIPLNFSGDTNKIPQTEILRLSKEPSLSFKIFPPFHNYQAIDFSNEEVFTQMPFEELRQQRAKEKLPFFVAVVRETQGVIHAYDAISWITERLKYQEKRSPYSRQEISDAMIYKLEPGLSYLDSFCSLEEIDNRQKNYSSIILATDLDPTPKIRGGYRFYLGGWYHRVQKDLKSAEFWYLKSTEDQCYLGHLGLAELYKKSRNECLKQLDKALLLCPSNQSEHIQEWMDEISKTYSNHDFFT